MEKLKNILESAKNKIDKLNGKRVCDQVSNSCGCCNEAHILISLEEKSLIIEFLNKNQNIKKEILENLSNENKCIFYLKKKKRCLIYSLRPISCRYVSYKIFEKENCFKTCSPILACKENLSTVITISKEKVKDFDYPLKSFKLGEQDYYFIDQKIIQEYEEYKKNQIYNLKNIVEEIKKSDC
jgi:Fe-S-cluster containining protein